MKRKRTVDFFNYPVKTPLATVTHLLPEWDYVRNAFLGFFPESISFKSGADAWWICQHGHNWKARISARVGGNKCPFCSGLHPSLENNFGTLYPHLLDEWCYSMNEGVDPYKIVIRSEYQAIWKCKNFHFWQTAVKTRTKGNGCPYCANKIVCSTNSLKVRYPDIAQEFDVAKNGISPDKILPFSPGKFWFTCSKCEWSWYARLEARCYQNKGCPSCFQSRGEKKVAKFLKSKNILFQTQFTFPETEISALRFDFAIFLPRRFVLVEYQGEQHYRPASFSKDQALNEEKFRLLQERDQRKRDYCSSNNIDLLEIKYTDYKKVESILHNYLEL